MFKKPQCPEVYLPSAHLTLQECYIFSKKFIPAYGEKNGPLIGDLQYNGFGLVPLYLECVRSDGFRYLLYRN